MNVTIDDQYGDSLTGALPTYLPMPSVWSQGATCTDCKVRPSVSLAQNGTWHDTTWSPGGAEGDGFSVELNFDGTAIYVFCILANTIEDSPTSTTLTNLSFTLDGNFAGTFVHVPTTSTDYEYNALVYSNTELSSNSNSQHQLIMETVGTTTSSLVLFDYALRTVDATGSVAPLAPSAPSAPSTPSAPSVPPAPPVSSIPSVSPRPTTMSAPSVPLVPSVSAPSSPSASSASSRPLAASAGLALKSTSVSVSASNGSASPSASIISIPGSSSSSKRVSAGTVAGGVIGGVGALLLLFLCFYLLRRRKKSVRNDVLQQKTKVNIEPFVENQPFILANNVSRKNVAEAPGQIPQFQGAFYPSTASDVFRSSNSRNAPPNGHHSGTTFFTLSAAQSSTVNTSDAGSRAGTNSDELAGRVEQMQQALAQLQARQTNNRDAENLRSDDEDLRRQIVTLQAEVERLQAGQQELIRDRYNADPLPSYHETFLVME